MKTIKKRTRAPLRSRFRIWAFIIVPFLLLITALIAIVIALLDENILPPLGIGTVLTLLPFIWIWLVFGELRTKVIKVEIHDEEIIVSNYFGLGSKKIYGFFELEGFEIVNLASEYDSYEYLYLIKNGKKVVKLSEFYHSNYADLKKKLKTKVPELGEKPFRLLQEIKEIFS